MRPRLVSGEAGSTTSATSTLAARTWPWESPDRPPRDSRATPPRTKAVRRGRIAATGPPRPAPQSRVHGESPRQPAWISPCSVRTSQRPRSTRATRPGSSPSYGANASAQESSQPREERDGADNASTLQVRIPAGSAAQAGTRRNRDEGSVRTKTFMRGSPLPCPSGHDDARDGPIIGTPPRVPATGFPAPADASGDLRAAGLGLFLFGFGLGGPLR